jgi:hypothetical protein
MFYFQGLKYNMAKLNITKKELVSTSLNLMAIDIFHNMFYSIYNIPAKPLPQGMRNMVGFFVLGVE